MFGQALFADIPFSERGNSPHVETGWIKECKEPCAVDGWEKQRRNEVPTIHCEDGAKNWTVIK